MRRRRWRTAGHCMFQLSTDETIIRSYLRHLRIHGAQMVEPKVSNIEQTDVMGLGVPCEREECALCRALYARRYRLLLFAVGFQNVVGLLQIQFTNQPCVLISRFFQLIADVVRVKGVDVPECIYGPLYPLFGSPHFFNS